MNEVNPVKMALGAMCTLLNHVRSRLTREPTRSLRSKTSRLARTRALTAKALTSMSPSALIAEAPVMNRRMTKADLALSKLADRAEPGKCYTLNEIAEVMDITRERVRQIEQEAMRTFRNRLSILLKSEGVTPSDVASIVAAANVE